MRSLLSYLHLMGVTILALCIGRYLAVLSDPVSEVQEGFLPTDRQTSFSAMSWSSRKGGEAMQWNVQPLRFRHSKHVFVPWSICQLPFQNQLAFIPVVLSGISKHVVISWKPRLWFCRSLPHPHFSLLTTLVESMR